MVFFLEVASFVVSLFPLRVLLGAGRFIGWVWFYLVRFRRAIVFSNLEHATNLSIGGCRLHDVAKKNFEHYGMLVVEFIQSFGWSREDYLREVSVEGLDNILPMVRSGRGGFILTGHIGNWEMAIGGAAAAGVPLDIIIKKPRARWIERLLDSYRRKMGVGVHFETGTARDILKAVNRGRTVAFVFDQFMGPPIGLPVAFFGREAGTAVSLALLVEKKNVPIWPAYAVRRSTGRMSVVFEKPIDFGVLPEDRNQRLYFRTQRLNDVLERTIQREPSQWLWLHRRWKDYLGQPRWSLVSQWLIMLFVVGCASQPLATPTGITLPVDHEVSIPTFDIQKTGEPSLPKPELVVPLKADDHKEAANKKEHKWSSRKLKKINIHSGTVKIDGLSETPKVVTIGIVPKERIPFEIGEQLQIDFGWMALPAGRATIEVREGSPFNGRPTYHLFGHILSSKIVDAVYKIDNSVESLVDRSGLIPYKFLLHMLESHQKKETVVNFDHPKQKARYWAKRISEKWGNEDTDRLDDLTPSARDMFSALYFARTLDYSLNRKESFVIYENGQNWEIDLTPVSNEVVTNKVGAFQCWKVFVKVSLKNVLRPIGNTYLWLSDDSKKYIVKFDTKIKVGSIHGNLVGIRDRL